MGVNFKYYLTVIIISWNQNKHQLKDYRCDVKEKLEVKTLKQKPKKVKTRKQFKVKKRILMSMARVPIQENNHSQQGHSDQQVTPFQVLKVKVYPVINNVILKLIDHIVKSQEVEKHEQRLKKKKLLDELERKYIEREIQKEELGSDYEQSDDQQYYKKLEMKKDDVQKIITKRLEKNKVRNSSQQHDKEVSELGQNVFSPVQFIIKELKNYQILKAEGRLDQWEKKNQKKTQAQTKMNQNTQQPTKMEKNQEFDI